MPTTGKATSPQVAQPRAFSFHGQGGTLFGIHIVNLFLGLVTLGIYSFWGRVRVRKYLWGQVEFEGDRLSYHGTGSEVLRGWIKAAVLFGLPYMALRLLPPLLEWTPKYQAAAAGLGGLLILFFIPLAVVGSRRYRLSRSAWRGIRFSFRGSSGGYAKIFWVGGLLDALTLGLYTPFYDMKREAFLVGNTWLGSQKLEFDGRGGDLFGTFLLAALLAIPTLGLSLIWYTVRRKRYVWAHTCLQQARFESKVTFGGMFWLDFVNALLVIITLGFAMPWVEVRRAQYLVDTLSLEGALDLEAIIQEAQAATATGEELASFFDLDFDLG